METDKRFFHSPRPGDILMVLLAGIVVSSISIGLAWAVGNFLIAGPICGDNTSGLCSVPFTLSYNIFLILGALASITWFVYGRIFRPALVALPAIVICWSLPTILSSVLELGLPVFALINVVLIAFSYLVFYWLVRIKNFFLVLLVWLGVVVALRLFLIL